MKKIHKKTKKFFIKSTLITTFLLSSLLVAIKFKIPNEYEFIDPISLYGTLLSTVVFVYWFMISPAVAEYKESEKLVVDVKNSLWNIEEDLKYLHWLKTEFNVGEARNILTKIKQNFYYNIADNEEREITKHIEDFNEILLLWEKAWITANHIIRTKNDMGIIQKSYLRIHQIKELDSLPKIVHNLKNFMTIFVISILLFMNFWDGKWDFVYQVQESLMLFLISFLYIYLTFVINWLENPFDKRKFTGYIDLSFLKK